MRGPQKDMKMMRDEELKTYEIKEMMFSIMSVSFAVNNEFYE